MYLSGFSLQIHEDLYKHTMVVTQITFNNDCNSSSPIRPSIAPELHPANIYATLQPPPQFVQINHNAIICYCTIEFQTNLKQRKKEEVMLNLQRRQ